MPIPDFNEDGLLPLGIYDCSLDEVESRFARFQTTDKRLQLFDKLLNYIKEVRAIKRVSSVIIDGSFVTGIDIPNDIDLVLILPPDHNFAEELKPVEYNVLSRKRVNKRYEFNVFLAQEHSLVYEQYVTFFQQVKHKPSKNKGVLRIIL